MKLIFTHIIEHKILKQISIPFNSQFKCFFDGRTLTIKENPDYLDDYYDGVNISSIIGNNGSGKTSILEFIENRLEYNDSIGVIVWLDKDNETFIIQELNLHEKILYNLCKSHNKLNDDNVETLRVTNISNFNFSKKAKTRQVTDLSAEYTYKTKKRRVKSLNQLLRFLHSDYWAQYHTTVTYSFKLRGWNTSIKSWIKKSLESEILRISNSPDSYRRHLQVIENMDYSLFQSFIKSKDDNIEAAEHYLSKLVDEIFRKLQSTMEHNSYKPENNNSIDVILLKNIFSIFKHTLNNSPADNTFSQIACYQLFKHLLFSNSLSNELISEIIHTSFNEFHRSDSVNDKKLLDQIESEISFIVKTICEDYENLKGFSKSIRRNRHFKLKPSKNNDYIAHQEGHYSGVEEIETSDAEVILSTITRIGSLPEYLQNNIDYGWSGLSSGEFAKISIFSSLYNKLVNTGFERTDAPNYLVVIDEADLYLHPEWQRVFVSDLVGMIVSLEACNNIQFIITTHSPLIIGDFLPEDIVTLKLENGRPIVANSLGFGTKLSDAYLDGMFLDSTYGEHSRGKLQHLIDIKMHSQNISQKDLKLTRKISNSSLREALLGD